MIHIRNERFVDFMEEFAGLSHDHYKEVETNQEHKVFSPNYGNYIQLDTAGLLICITARDDHKLIGYCISTIMPHLHYSTTIYVNNDVLFLSKEYRGKWIGMKMLRKLVSESRSLGGKILHIETKEGSHFDSIFNRLGFEVGVTRTHEKVL